MANGASGVSKRTGAPALGKSLTTASRRVTARDDLTALDTNDPLKAGLRVQETFTNFRVLKGASCSD